MTTLFTVYILYSIQVENWYDPKETFELYVLLLDHSCRSTHRCHFCGLYLYFLYLYCIFMCAIWFFISVFYYIFMMFLFSILYLFYLFCPILSSDSLYEMYIINQTVLLCLATHLQRDSTIPHLTRADIAGWVWSWPFCQDGESPLVATKVITSPAPHPPSVIKPSTSPETPRYGRSNKALSSSLHMHYEVKPSEASGWGADSGGPGPDLASNWPSSGQSWLDLCRVEPRSIVNPLWRQTLSGWVLFRWKFSRLSP